MTEQEWIAVAQYLDGGWAGPPFDHARDRVYRAELGHLPYETVMVAIRAAAARDPQFRPSHLAIRAAAEPAATAPAWANVCYELGTHPALRQLPRVEYSDEKNRQLALLVAEAVESIHPAVAGMLADVGLEALRTAPLDPRFGIPEGEEGIELRVRLARLKDAYHVRVERWNLGDRRQLATHEFANRLLPAPVHAGMAELVESLRPLQQLPAGPASAVESTTTGSTA